MHTASVNSIGFGPHELGLALATASSDGSIAILTHQQDGTWSTSKVFTQGSSSSSACSCKAETYLLTALGTSIMTQSGDTCRLHQVW